MAILDSRTMTTEQAFTALENHIEIAESRIARLEAALDELLQEPGNPFLGYEMARYALSGTF